MKHIFEEYGDVIMQAIGGIGILALIIDLLREDGLLRGLIVAILESGC